ncbi:MAG: hypothetical protein Q8N16_01005 [bacterium]|nr:hypothetical protein [bacterium]
MDPDGNYLVGTITFADGAGCYDGCGSFSANITPREVQAMDDGTIVFHFQIDFLEVSGNPYFRQEFLNATMYINNVEFKPTGSSLPSQVTPELVGKPLMGYLTFPGRILAVDPANSPEYSFRLEIPLLNQPLVGGWLKPKS